jgi:hypothetical protein
MISLELLVDLAKQVELEEPIDWVGMRIDSDTAYKMVASSILEKYVTGELESTALLASLVKLTVENFVLHLRLLKYKEIDE